MLIGELAAASGASPRSIRHYESLGLLTAVRKSNGYRSYTEETVERIRAIRFLLASGLSTATIAKILPAMMYQHCQLGDPEVRKAIESEALRIKAEITSLQQSYMLLRAALEKGSLRRPRP